MSAPNLDEMMSMVSTKLAWKQQGWYEIVRRRNIIFKRPVGLWLAKSIPSEFDTDLFLSVVAVEANNKPFSRLFLDGKYTREPDGDRRGDYYMCYGMSSPAWWK